MPLETGTYISDLNSSNPVGASDPKSQGDDHLRLIKSTILATFPSIDSAISLTDEQINDVAIKGEANTFTQNRGVVVSAGDPQLGLHESDVSVDNKYWRLMASGETFYLETENDARSSRDQAITINRTGITVDNVRLGQSFEVDDANGRVEFNTGLKLRVYDATDADAVELEHNGTNLLLSDIAGTTAFNIDDMHVYIRGGSDFRVYDATNSDYFEISHTGVNVDLTIIGTTNIAVKGGGSGGYLQLETGLRFRTFDTTNADYIGLTETGTQAQILSNNNNIYLYPGLTEVAILSPTLIDIRNGVQLRVRDASDADYMNFRHDGSDAYIAFQNAGWLIFDNLTTGIQILDGATTRFYDATNADYFKIEHNGADARLGVNTGNIFIEDPVDGPATSAQEVGFRGTPNNEQNGNYTLVLSDAGRTIRKASGGAGETITIPANGSVAFPVGTIIVIVNDGGGDLSIAITTDTLEEYGTGSTGTRTLPDNNKAVIEKVTSTLWKYSATG